MVNARVKSLLRAVLFDFISCYIQKRPDYCNAAFTVPLVSNARESVGSRSSHNAEKYGFALVIGVLCHGHRYFFCRHSLASYFLGHLEKCLISGISSCFFGSKLLLLCNGRAIVNKASAAESLASAQLFHICLVLFGCSRSELVVDVNRVYCQVHILCQLAKHAKKAHRIRASGES